MGSIDSVVASKLVFPDVPPGDQIACGHAPVADTPLHRRAQLREFEVERRLALRRLLGGD